MISMVLDAQCRSVTVAGVEFDAAFLAFLVELAQAGEIIQLSLDDEGRVMVHQAPVQEVPSPVILAVK